VLLLLLLLLLLQQLRYPAWLITVLLLLPRLVLLLYRDSKR
jgi:hypothetical protein